VESIGFIQSIECADISVCENADTFLQSKMWGEFKSRFGWKPRAFLIEWKDNGTIPMLSISRNLAPGFSFVYVPWGPQLPSGFPPENRPKALSELAVKIKPFLQKPVFIRFDPPWYSEDGSYFSENDEASFLSAGLKKAAASIQPPDTVIVNLTAPAEKILEEMKPKWRYNILYAGKKNVIVKSEGVQGLETFYSLLKETSARDGILIHSFDYYKTLFEICGKYGNELTLRLYTASHEGEVIASIIVLFRGRYATYLYGASSDKKRNMMPTYALQWKAMQDAKEAGCLFYDLFGIPPDDDPNHPMAGLYRFKTGFGGQIIHRPGCWDYPYKTFIYNLFNCAESFRKKLRDQKKKR
jgi:lipid II:glycine glycyltransferase (peptidoglycan interpeptide bridge formation enzyme)